MDRNMSRGIGAMPKSGITWKMKVEFGMGNTGIPVADSFRYLAKLIQYCKV